MELTQPTGEARTRGAGPNAGRVTNLTSWEPWLQKLCDSPKAGLLSEWMPRDIADSAKFQFYAARNKFLANHAGQLTSGQATNLRDRTFNVDPQLYGGLVCLRVPPLVMRVPYVLNMEAKSISSVSAAVASFTVVEPECRAPAR